MGGFSPPFAVRAMLLALVPLLWAPGARADGYDSALRDGVAARDRARETQDRTDWARALDHFRRAVALSPTREAHFELAEAAARLNLVAIAHDHYRRALERGLSGRAGRRAQAFVTVHADSVAHIVLEAPPGTAIYVASAERLPAPLGAPLAVPVGSVSLRLERPGYEPWTRRLYTHPREQLRLTPLWVPMTSPDRAAVAEEVEGAWVGPALFGGGALLAAGGGTLLATTVLLSGARADLGELCEVFEADRCVATTPQKLRRAQAAADRVETLVNVRWAALPALVLGAAGIATALAFPELGSDDGARIDLGLAPGAACLSLRGRF